MRFWQFLKSVRNLFVILILCQSIIFLRLYPLLIHIVFDGMIFGEGLTVGSYLLAIVRAVFDMNPASSLRQI